jgi:hypothetical protein
MVHPFRRGTALNAPMMLSRLGVLAEDCRVQVEPTCLPRWEARRFPRSIPMRQPSTSVLSSVTLDAQDNPDAVFYLQCRHYPRHCPPAKLNQRCQPGQCLLDPRYGSPPLTVGLERCRAAITHYCSAGSRVRLRSDAVTCRNWLYCTPDGLMQINGWFKRLADCTGIIFRYRLWIRLLCIHLRLPGVLESLVDQTTADLIFTTCPTVRKACSEYAHRWVISAIHYVFTQLPRVTPCPLAENGCLQASVDDAIQPSALLSTLLTWRRQHLLSWIPHLGAWSRPELNLVVPSKVALRTLSTTSRGSSTAELPSRPPPLRRLSSSMKLETSCTILLRFIPPQPKQIQRARQRSALEDCWCSQSRCEFPHDRQHGGRWNTSLWERDIT